ncbi:DUF808 domain-containing protein [Rhodoligotrophos ferricapiens]|uniref:DUF808 domain-containing protein n=1 Tax=Rhodoligotrophos ferricapiens TaxID=3069264 RepID=UPI00315C7DC7
MSIGLLGLLDDVAGIAKVAAASIDDVAGMAAKAGLKATGAVIDDAAVTPSYVRGFTAERELPIVARIAKGSLKNKLIFLLPAALFLSFVLPWLIMPLLMIGGAYLCYEGAEKVYHALFPHHAAEHETQLGSVAINPKSLEDEKVASAIKTDFILSAEIMTIALAEIPPGNFALQAAVLVLVAFGITVGVYGVVALIVKADDFGVRLASNTNEGLAPGVLRSLGRGLVKAMPGFMTLLGIVGTAAMIWVGGGIIVHGLEEFGFSTLGHMIHDAAHAAASFLPPLGPVLNWATESAAYGIVGLVIGTLLIPIASYLISPVWQGLKSLGRQAA